jgi:hypothetical protein
VPASLFPTATEGRLSSLLEWIGPVEHKKGRRVLGRFQVEQGGPVEAIDRVLCDLTVSRRQNAAVADAAADQAEGGVIAIFRREMIYLMRASRLASRVWARVSESMVVGSLVISKAVTTPTVPSCTQAQWSDVEGAPPWQ